VHLHDRIGLCADSGALRYEVADMNEDAHHYRDDPAADRRHRAHPLSPLATLTQLPALVVLGRLPVPVLAIDREGTIIFANEPFTRMLGHTTETVTAMKFDQIFSAWPPHHHRSRPSTPTPSK
jgi:PAS domain-containing protein